MKVRVLGGLEPLVSSTDEDAELPEGWARVKLPQIARINMGQSPPGATYNERGEGLPFFQGKADFGPLIPTVRVWCTDPKKIAESGDILMSVRAPVGPTNVADRRCIIGRGLAAISPEGSIPTPFLLYALRLQEKGLAGQGAGSTFTAINRDHLADVDIDLPPLAEQERIVEKVEALLAQVDASRARLAKVPAILKRFRQAVLAAACSGRLTADWRDGSPDQVHAIELLERIKSARGQAIRQHAAGRRLPRSADDESPEASQAERPDLPEEWAWTPLAEILHLSRSAGYGVLQPGPNVEDGVPMVRVCDLSGGTVLVDQLKRIAPTIDEQYRRTRLQGGEVLVSLVGTIGRTAVAPSGAVGANIARAVAMLPICDDVHPRFLQLSLAEPSRNAELIDLAREVARKTLNLGLLKGVWVLSPRSPSSRRLFAESRRCSSWRTRSSGASHRRQCGPTG